MNTSRERPQSSSIEVDAECRPLPHRDLHVRHCNNRGVVYVTDVTAEGVLATRGELKIWLLGWD